MSHILAVVQRGKEHDFPRRSAIRDVHANVHHRLVVQARALPLVRPTFVTSPLWPPLPLNAVRLRACDRHERVSERRERGRRRGGALG